METYANALLIAIPVFIVLMLIELLYGYFKQNQTYTILDTVASISSGLINVLKDSLGLIVILVSYPFLLSHLSVLTLEATIPTFIIAFISLDVATYWNHRLSHKVNVFWNLHVIHHSSEEFNLACALRQPISNILGFFAIFLIPAAILGVPNELIQVLTPVHLFLQFWYHTKHIGKLGWLEYVLVTPSQHRVHHAINEIYLDKNLSAIFSIWDRVFGTFQEELESVPPVYGVLKPVSTWNPVIINFQHLYGIAKDAWRTKNWTDKFKIWFMPTGWRPDDVALKHPIEITKDPYAQVKYRTTYSNLFSGYFIGQMLFTVTGILLLFYFFGELTRIQLLCSGIFLSIGIFGYSGLMDRYRWAGIFELGRAVLGLIVAFIFPEILGLTIFPESILGILTTYFVLSFAFTFYFAFLDKGFSLSAVQTS